MCSYEYNPKDFQEMPLMEEYMMAFYEAYEAYKKEDNNTTYFALDRAGQDLFFAIKHREVEGWLSPAKTDELYEYFFGRLLND